MKCESMLKTYIDGVGVMTQRLPASLQTFLQREGGRQRFDKTGSLRALAERGLCDVSASFRGSSVSFALSGILLFADPRCGHTLEEPRFDGCTSGSSFNKQCFSRLQAAQRRTGRLPPSQLSPMPLEVWAPDRHLTPPSLSFPVTRFCAFSTNRCLFSAAQIYWLPLFSLARSSSAPTPSFSGQTITQRVSQQHLLATHPSSQS